MLASNNEFILLPVNEPTFGTKRKSQIQNYLEHNNGSGVQHIALKTADIFHTVRAMRERTQFGGLGFMPKPSAEYYSKVPSRIGEHTLTQQQLVELEELGLLADKDDQGVLLQVQTTITILYSTTLNTPAISSFFCMCCSLYYYYFYYYYHFF